MGTDDRLLQFLITGITNGAIYALIALGFVSIYKVTGIVNFAQGESTTFGALFLITLTEHGEVPLGLAFFLTIVLVSIAGAVFYGIAIQSLAKSSTLTLIIITIGASIALRGLALVLWGTDSHLLPSFSASEPLRWQGLMVRSQSIWVIGVTSVCLLCLYWFFKFTRFGKALRACADNPTAAILMGISQSRMGMISFSLGAALGAVAGQVIAPLTFATYDMGAMLGLKGFVAAVMGGVNSFPIAVLGGIFLGIFEVLAAGYISSGAKDATAFGLLLVLLMLRPGRRLLDIRRKIKSVMT